MYPRFKLKGCDEKTRQAYLDYYRRIGFNKKRESILLQAYKYANVFAYVMEDGNIITLPVDKCQITAMALSGKPLVEYDLADLLNAGGYAQSGDQKYFKDREEKNKAKGYPKEIADAIRKRQQSVQLDPERLFALQGTKEDWTKYAVPMIAAYLPHLAKKALISQMEDSLLNLGTRAFVHVRYGSPKEEADMMPNVEQLNQVRGIFSRAMNGFPLAVTNNWAKGEVVQPETKFLFENDNYKAVNNALLSAGGISGIVVRGIAEDGSTFASAQVSVQTATARIEQMLGAFADMMTGINRLVYPLVTGKQDGNAPVFEFMPLDMSGKKAAQEAGMALFVKGVLSTDSMMRNYGYDLDEELEKIQAENDKGVPEVMRPRDGTQEEAPKDDTGKETRGRNTLPDDERNSDPENAHTGKQPKPSNEDGSLPD